MCFDGIELNGDSKANDRQIIIACRSCAQTQATANRTNHEEHSDMFSRIGKLEQAVAAMNARVAAWAAIGAIVGGAALQIVVKLVTK